VFDQFALADLRVRVAGSVAPPGEDGYELSAPWNQSVTMSPAAVVAAANTDDVVAAVRSATTSGLRVAVQATGHGAVPYGDDVMLIHTGRLQDYEINAKARTAKVGAGVLSQQLLDATAPFGLAPLVGAAGSVGVVGYLSGGGIGPLVSTYGVSSDYVRALDVVTGQGEVCHVTETEHPDLFWGLRGGKATLGIITAVEIGLLDLDTVYAGALYFDGADASSVLHAWSRWSESLPDRATTSLALVQLPDLPFVARELAGRRSVALRFTTPLPVLEAEGLLAPMRAAAIPILDTVAERPYSDIGRVHDEPTTPMPVQHNQTLLHSLPAEAVDALIDTAGPDSGSPLLVVELRRLGGALKRDFAAPSAFSHRDAAYALHAVGLSVPRDPQNVAGAASQRILDSVDPWATGGIYANFVATTDQDRLATAYDDATRQRLLTVAQQYDPAGTLGTAGQLAR
jgi:FAD/FMN-containing dehydrogenase